ncbi:MAG: hypothetical protein OEV40_25340 [Acidimicrobiia bacterium]|nr:hypothetical protein [Acidimicrobiia bacterium]
MTGGGLSPAHDGTARWARLAFGALVAVIVAAGCSGSDPVAAPDPQLATTRTEPADVAPSAPRTSIQGVPDTPAGRRFAEVAVAALGGTLTEDDVTSHFDPSFLEQVPAASFVLMAGSLPELLGSSPVVANLTITTDHAVAGTLVNTADGTTWTFSTSVSVTEPHLVLGYTIVPDAAPEPDASIADLGGVDEAWTALGPRSDLLVTELAPGADPVAACEAPSEASQPALSIGSGFKLWVLAALATAIEEGRVSWTDEVTILDRLVSLPSGQLQAEAHDPDRRRRCRSHDRHQRRHRHRSPDRRCRPGGRRGSAVRDRPP